MSSERLLSLDVLRGITVAGMILVNNPGDWGNIYVPLEHSVWNGLTPTDLIFPFFMFVMGVSMSFSFAKFGNQFSPQFRKKLIKRTIVLFLFGMSLSWFSLFLNRVFYGNEGFSIMQFILPFQNIRILGVLQRLALTYFFSSLLIVLMPKRTWLITATVSILLLYAIILPLGNGYDFSEHNIIAIIDNALFGANHVYQDWLPDGSRIHFDPEGLLSTFPGIAHVLLGFICGNIIRKKAMLENRLLQLSLIGISLLFLGLLLNYGCPINKKVWSTTYVLATCGFAYLFLVWLTWLIDIKQIKRWSLPFQVFGTNPIFIYLFASLLAIALEIIPINGMSIKDWLYAPILTIVPMPHLASLIYALIYVIFNGAIGYVLFKKHVFIKI